MHNYDPPAENDTHLIHVSFFFSDTFAELESKRGLSKENSFEDSSFNFLGDLTAEQLDLILDCSTTDAGGGEPYSNHYSPLVVANPNEILPTKTDKNTFSSLRNPVPDYSPFSISSPASNVSTEDGIHVSALSEALSASHGSGGTVTIRKVPQETNHSGLLPGMTDPLAKLMDNMSPPPEIQVGLVSGSGGTPHSDDEEITNDFNWDTLL